MEKIRGTWNESNTHYYFHPVFLWLFWWRLSKPFPTAALACGPVRRWSIPTSDPFFFCRERLKLCVSRLVKSLQSHWINDTPEGMHGDKNGCWLPVIMSFWLLLNMDFHSLYTRPTPQLDLQLLRREPKPQSERHWLVHLFALDFTSFILYCLLVNVKTSRIKFKATFSLQDLLCTNQSAIANAARHNSEVVLEVLKMLEQNSLYSFTHRRKEGGSRFCLHHTSTRKRFDLFSLNWYKQATQILYPPGCTFTCSGWVSVFQHQPWVKVLFLLTNNKQRHMLILLSLDQMLLLTINQELKGHEYAKSQMIFIDAFLWSPL